MKNSWNTRSKTSTFGLTYCQIEILQIRKKQNIKNKRTAHLQHSAVQFSTSTFAVHYSTIQYQHICSTVLNIYSTFQVTCTFAAHYSTIQHQYITLKFSTSIFAAHFRWPAHLQHIKMETPGPILFHWLDSLLYSELLQHNCSTYAVQIQHICSTSIFQHNYSTFQHNYST